MDQEDYETIMITIDFTLLFSAALRNLLGSWVLGYEVANYVANYPIELRSSNRSSQLREINEF